MKILLAHTFYELSAPSGEDFVYPNEVALERDVDGYMVLTHFVRDFILAPWIARRTNPIQKSRRVINAATRQL